MALTKKLNVRLEMVIGTKGGVLHSDSLSEVRCGKNNAGMVRIRLKKDMIDGMDEVLRGPEIEAPTSRSRRELKTTGRGQGSVRKCFRPRRW